MEFSYEWPILKLLNEYSDIIKVNFHKENQLTLTISIAKEVNKTESSVETPDKEISSEWCILRKLN